MSSTSKLSLLFALALGSLPSVLGCDSADPPDAADAITASDTSADGAPDGALDGAPDGAPDTLADTLIDPDKGLGIDFSSTTGGPVPRYDPSSAEFTATPWPTDRLRTSDGHLDLSVIPNPDHVDLIEHYLEYGMSALDGYSRNGAIYFELSAPLDMASLPSDAVSMTDPKALAQLVDVTPESATFGQRFPVVFKFIDDGDDPYVVGPTLVMRARYGFPLADGGTYCALITRGLRDPAGNYLEPAPAFVEALKSEASLAPLRAWLPGSKLREGDLAVATCFTTQDATGELRHIQRFLDARETTGLFEVNATGQTQHFYEVQAKYLGPNFQSGEKPYRDEGGDVVFDAAGEPIVQEDETIRVRILIPRNQVMPASGWPVLLYGHGTGGDWSSCLNPVATVAAQEGLATLCIDEPLHGIRGVGSSGSYLDSFNFLNAASGRMSFRQAAADSLWLTHMIADGRFDLSADQAGGAGAVTLDPDKILFFGHSHGALAGILLLGTDPRVQGAILSGGSGVMSITLLERKDVADIQALLATMIDVDVDQLDTFHPIVTLIQLLVDATDPVNYAPYWFNPVTGGEAKHVFMTTGTLDAESPSAGALAVGAAAGLPLIEPVVDSSRAHELRGIEPVSTPLSQNIATSTGRVVTGGLKQYLGGDHFVAFTDAGAQAAWRSFLRSFAAGEAPVIAP